MSAISLLTYNHTDSTVTFAVSGVAYEYFLPFGDHLRRISVIAKHSQAKALNYAKAEAERVQRCPSAKPAASASTDMRMGSATDIHHRYPIGKNAS